MAGHIVHLTVETTRQPVLQTLFCGGQIDTRHADLGKSELTGPGPYLGNELTAVERHAPIVETRLLRDEAATQALADALSRQPAMRNACIELRGNLGAGKTTFVRHLLRALGVSGRIKSPTYAVVEPYEVSWPVRAKPVEAPVASPNPSTSSGGTALRIWHFDFYRFSDPREWEDAGFRDIYSSPGLKLAEWPDQAAGLLPVADLVIELQAQPDESRRATLTAQTATGAALLSALPEASA
jgi:tRNA threonylcarbamoyladenosine biosynthesis protein TsaE